MRITQKLGVLVAVPLCAVSGFGAIALVSSGSGALQADRLWSLMNTANAAGNLVTALQDERTLAAYYLTSSNIASTMDRLDAQIAVTEQATTAYHALVSRLPAQSAQTNDLLRRIEVDLAQIKELRDQIRMRQAPALSAIIFQYRIVIADLAGFRESVAQADGASAAVTQNLRAADALYQASEYTGQEETSGLRGAIANPLSSAAQSDIAAEQRGYSQALETFDAVAAPEWVQRPDEALTGGTISNADRYEDIVARTSLDKIAQVGPQEWIASLDARRYALDQVQLDLNMSILDSIAQIRDHQRKVAEIEGASIAATLMIAIVVSLRLGRPMIRGLRELRDGAHAVAYEYLPRAVDSMRAQGSLTGRSPEEFAENFGEAVRVNGDDELSAVARAFNAVHTEAIRTAAEQVLLRAGVGATFVALARRGERLTGALTSELDRAEAAEQDPDRLARLFVLDHLASRMSRNNESLLVLGGEGTVRIRDHAVPLVDVIRAALGRIERYTRVDVTSVDPRIEVVPGAIDHLVHLTAELLDNATAFSPPDSRVAVEAIRTADRVVVRIIDGGIGMTMSQRAELNARLASPRQVDISTVRAMGLTVVAHLASWYNINIELRARAEGGTVAEIALPPALYSSGLPELTSGAAPSLGTGVSALQDVAPATGAGWAAEGADADSGLVGAGSARVGGSVLAGDYDPVDAGSAGIAGYVGNAADGAGTVRAGQRADADRGWAPVRNVPPSPLSPVWPQSPGDDAAPSATPWQDDSALFGPAWPQSGTGRRRAGTSATEPVGAVGAAGASSESASGYSSAASDIAWPAEDASASPLAGRHAAAAMTPVPAPGLADLEGGVKPSPWLTGARQRPATASGHSVIPTATGSGQGGAVAPHAGQPHAGQDGRGGIGGGYADQDAYQWPSTDFASSGYSTTSGSAGPAESPTAAQAQSAYAAYAPPPTFGPPSTPYEPTGHTSSTSFRPEATPTHDDVIPPYAQRSEHVGPAVHLPEPPAARSAESPYAAAPAPEAVAAPAPAPAAPAPPPAPAPAQTTIHGLPIRVPQTSLPAEARAAGAGAAIPATPTERDPRRVSATMAAYARGLNARPGQPGSGGQSLPQYRATGYYGVPTNDSEDDYEQHPYPPMPNTGNY